MSIPYSRESHLQSMPSEIAAGIKIQSANPEIKVVKVAPIITPGIIRDFGPDLTIYEGEKKLGYVEVQQLKALTSSGFPYQTFRLYERRLKPNYDLPCIFFVFNPITEGYMFSDFKVIDSAASQCHRMRGLRKMTVNGNEQLREEFWMDIPKTVFTINRGIETLTEFFKG